MSGLAVAAAELGASVSGSDREESAYLERLRAAGIEIFVGHDPANVPTGADLVRSTAVPDENPEIVAALEAGQKVLHRSQLLAELAALRETCVTVAGSHGKTTTSAMIAHALDALGADPSYFVGGEVTIGPRKTNAHIGNGKIVVVEADESDGSFVRYKPQTAVVTNIEFEHPETWNNLDELMAAFARHLAQAERVVIKAEQPRLDELDLGERALTFSIHDPSADFFAGAIEEPDDPATGTSFDLGGVAVRLGVRGEHNVENALAALATLAMLGYEPQRAGPALTGFTGVARRFERVGTAACGAAVYDDYAHHPTEVRAALTAARGIVGDGRIVVFFQPHLFSRTITYRRQFAEALVLADVVVVLDIFPAREQARDFPGVSGWTLASAVADHSGQRTVHYAPQIGDAETLANRILRADDLCLTMGAGSITELSRLIAAG
jgi:UDP-N-acetylmuramate--alanine ligase